MNNFYLIGSLLLLTFGAVDRTLGSDLRHENLRISALSEDFPSPPTDAVPLIRLKDTPATLHIQKIECKAIENGEACKVSDVCSLEIPILTWSVPSPSGSFYYYDEIPTACSYGDDSETQVAVHSRIIFDQFKKKISLTSSTMLLKNGVYLSIGSSEAILPSTGFLSKISLGSSGTFPDSTKKIFLSGIVSIEDTWLQP